MSENNTESKVIFITGASRGMGVEFAKAFLEAGYSVVATGRNTGTVAEAVGKSENLLVLKLDVTNTNDAWKAVQAAVDRFGRIDILINNAAVTYKGYFEEMSPEEINHQLEVNLIGQMNVTRAILPVMRNQRSGHIVTISSGAGLVGFEFSSMYATSKFAIEGWMSALQLEVEPFGINTTIVNPGFFRTDLISEKSMIISERSIDDYKERREAQLKWWWDKAGKQPGDPARLARALVKIMSEEQPPRRFFAGSDAIKIAELKANELLKQADAYRELSTNMTYDEEE